MARQTIEREALVQEAYRLAAEGGLASIGIREVAAACGVSVGTIYNHFPAKSDLVAEVVAVFWRDSLALESCSPRPDEDFVCYVGRVYAAMRVTLAEFRSDWLPEIRALALRGEPVGHDRERLVFDHMRAGLVSVLARDPKADVSRLSNVDADELCAFVLESMMSSLSDGMSTCHVLSAILRAALYAEQAVA